MYYKFLLGSDYGSNREDDIRWHHFSGKYENQFSCHWETCTGYTLLLIIRMFLVRALLIGRNLGWFMLIVFEIWDFIVKGILLG